MTSPETEEAIDRRQLAAFEDRYGGGSFERLLALFRLPCMTFAEIANRFGVTRERVRQWHARWLPAAPRGRTRQRLCGVYRQKRRLLQDPLFRTFYRHARPHVSPGGIHLIPARGGFRRRSVRIGEMIVAIKNTRAWSGSPSRSETAYALSRCPACADFVYYRLTESDYLVVPGILIPQGGTTFSDTPASKYLPYKNSFRSLVRGARADASQQEPKPETSDCR